MEYELTNNIEAGYIYNELLTKYPDGIPKMTWTTTDKTIITFEGEFDEKELKSFLDNITIKEWDKEIERTIIIERLNFTDRINKLKEYCKGKDLDFKYLPMSSGCFQSPPYINLQRFFFTRILTTKENEEVRGILKQDING